MCVYKEFIFSDDDISGLINRCLCQEITRILSFTAITLLCQCYEVSETDFRLSENSLLTSLESIFSAGRLTHVSGKCFFWQIERTDPLKCESAKSIFEPLTVCHEATLQGSTLHE